MMMNLNRAKNIRGIFAALLWITALFTGTAFSQNTKNIVILLSGNIQQYREAVDGFKEVFNPDGASVSYQEFTLDPNANLNDVLKKKIISASPDLFFTVGTQASLFAKNELRGTPVVFSMVLNPVENGLADSVKSQGAGLTGVCLNIPIEAQFRSLKEIKPSLKRVGILYDAKTSLTIVSDAEKAAKKFGFELVLKPVFSENNVSAALGEILSQVDCLWAYPDLMIYNPSTAQRIIMVTLNKNIAFMSFSKNFVKAGALAVLECDYRDIGRQSADMAERVLKDGVTQNISIEFPEKTTLVINKRTADMIGLDIPKDVLDGSVLYGN